MTRYGMSEQFGMVALEVVNNAYLGNDASLACSPETAARIDDEVIRLVKKAYSRAKSILSGNEENLHRLAARLLEKETITGEEFMELLEAGNIEAGGES